jgi:outer membrane lipoprotein-sorting protein
VAQGETRLGSGTLTSDTLTGQYGGRVTWKLPGRMKFSTLSAQGSYNQNRNTVTGLNQPTTQLLALWTANWSHKHTF